jgi:hypothetical protein
MLPSQERRGFPGERGEMVMIDALAFALVAVALGIPALIMAAMLGSHLKLEW